MKFYSQRKTKRSFWVFGFVIPAQAGIQPPYRGTGQAFSTLLDACLRRNDIQESDILFCAGYNKLLKNVIAQPAAEAISHVDSRGLLRYARNDTRIYEIY